MSDTVIEMTGRPTTAGMEHFPQGSDRYIDHPSHARPGIHPYPDKLYVVTMLSNPVRFRNRYANYWQFERHVAESGAVLYTAEIAFGGRPFEITEAHNPRHLQLRTRDELWHKENGLNLLIQRLPADAKYVAWIDADVTFGRPDWAQETLQLLQHYDVLQLFSTAIDLDVNGDPMANNTHRSFMSCYVEMLADPLAPIPNPNSVDVYSNPPANGVANVYWHPGYAWAARIDSLSKLGMLIDWAILGSGDWHMAWGLIGQMQNHLVPDVHPNYSRLCKAWQDRADEYVKRNVSYVPGTILHHFHGSKVKRRYGDRWNFLRRVNFDPLVDIKRDRQGLWALDPDNIALRDGIRAYARMRDEDER